MVGSTGHDAAPEDWLRPGLWGRGLGLECGASTAKSAPVLSDCREGAATRIGHRFNGRIRESCCCYRDKCWERVLAASERRKGRGGGERGRAADEQLKSCGKAGPAGSMYLACQLTRLSDGLGGTCRLLRSVDGSGRGLQGAGPFDPRRRGAPVQQPALCQ